MEAAAAGGGGTYSKEGRSPQVATKAKGKRHPNPIGQKEKEKIEFQTHVQYRKSRKKNPKDYLLEGFLMAEEDLRSKKGLKEKGKEKWKFHKNT